MQYKHLGSILLIAAMTLCACQHRHQPSEYIQTADSLLWSNPDSCLRYIESRTGELSEYDQNCEELIWQHAVYKIYNQVEDNLQLEKCKLYFDYIHNWERAGESDYVLGAHYLKHGDCFEATVHLKRAEDYYQYCQPKPILNGMLYLYLGAAAEENCMYEVAAEYYQKAIPYLKEAQKPLYLANVYSRLGGCWDGADSTMVITYLDSAQNYARQAGMEQMYRETRARKALYINKTDKKSKEKLLIDLIYLCDTSQLYQYAEIIAKEYLEHNELDKAHQYIEQLKKDTSVHIHSKEQV